MAILYGLLHGGFTKNSASSAFLTCVETKYKWQALAYSTLVRISFHALIKGHALGDRYRRCFWLDVLLLYKYKVKTSCRFPDSHMADIFGSGFII